MNQQRIAILTDSCADIPESAARKNDIFIAPLRLLFSDGEYEDGVSITATEVYRRLPSELPKTSLPSIERVESIFQTIREKGYEKVLAINFSAGLSGTCNLIRMVGEQFVGLEVVAIDSISASLGTGMMVMEAIRMIERGVQFPALCRAVRRLVQTTKVFFCINTLEYLQKGGRIGRISSVAGSLLNIKPILSFAPSGELVNVAKVRGRKQAIERMVSMAAETLPEGVRFNLAVAHGDSPAELREIRRLATEAMPGYESLLVGEIDCTLGAYVGPQLVGVGVQLLPNDLAQ